MREPGAAADEETFGGAAQRDEELAEEIAEETDDSEEAEARFEERSARHDLDPPPGSGKPVAGRGDEDGADEGA